MVAICDQADLTLSKQLRPGRVVVQYATPGRNYRFAWGWLYEIKVGDGVGTNSAQADSLSMARSVARDMAKRTGALAITETWR